MTATHLRALGTAVLLTFAFSACGDDTTVTTVKTKGLARRTPVGEESSSSSSILEQDTEAKSAVRLAQVLMETYYTDHQTYLGADEAKLVAMESTMANGAAASLTVSDTSGSTYAVAVDSRSGTGFGIAKREGGEVTRGCSEPGIGGCGDAGDW